MVAPENIELFERYGVLSQAEAQARYIAKAEQYTKVLNIEARTMLYMTRHIYACLPSLPTQVMLPLRLLLNRLLALRVQQR